ncbi:MAG: hypothetical protein ABL858_04785 [Candidatus Nitrotoga sp.]
MRAPKLSALSGLTILCAVLLGGCGGTGDTTAANATIPVTPAEANIGASYLPPDGAIAAASVLTQEDFPLGDANTSAAVDSEDMPPA